MQCVEALTNLLEQMQSFDDNGNITSNPSFDQLTMVARCLPILLLRVPPHATTKAKQQIVRHNCHLFLRGSWPSLSLKAKRELRALNDPAEKQATRSAAGSQSVFREQAILQRARALQLSRAMALLRSPGLSTDPADDIHKALQALHPQEDLDHVDAAEPLHKPPRNCFDFIDGSWLKLQIERSKAGTGVDQWGWDSKEMRTPLKHNSALMDAIAHTWARPLAQGYLPPKCRDHLAG